jgi:hypothetical protein
MDDYDDYGEIGAGVAAISSSPAPMLVSLEIELPMGEEAT